MQMERHTDISIKEASDLDLLREVDNLCRTHGDARSQSVVGIIERLNEIKLRKFDPAFARSAVRWLEDLSIFERGINATLVDILQITSLDIRANHPDAVIPAPPA